MVQSHYFIHSRRHERVLLFHRIGLTWRITIDWLISGQAIITCHLSLVVTLTSIVKAFLGAKLSYSPTHLIQQAASWYSRFSGARSCPISAMTMTSKFVPLHIGHTKSNPIIQYPNHRPSFLEHRTLRIRCAKRTGKQRYPSEKKKLKLKQKAIVEVKNKFDGFWRLSKLGVPVYNDPGKDFLGISDALLQEIAKALEFPVTLSQCLTLCLVDKGKS